MAYSVAAAESTDAEARADERAADDDTLDLLCQWFDEFCDLRRDQLTLWKRCRDYYDGEQWTDEEIQTLEGRNQPCITDNLIKDKVDSLLGLVNQTRNDPKAFPRNPTDEETSEAATDALRFVDDDTAYDRRRSEAAENFIVEGLAHLEIIIKKTRRDPTKILINRIDPMCSWYDPHSKEKDLSDREYAGIAKWMYERQAIAAWPDAKDIIEATIAEGQAVYNEDFADVPLSQWSDPPKKRLRVLECYWKEGADKIKRAVFAHGGFLEDPKDCVYHDEEGEHEDPYCFASPYVDRDGNRYGCVKRYLDPQDEVNHRRSKALHLLSVNQTIREEGAVESPTEMRKQVNRPDGDIVVTSGQMRFEIERNVELGQGQMLLLQDARQSLAAVGPNAALQGTGSQSASGRKTQIDQQAGMLPVGTILDGIRDLDERVYRKCWNRIHQFWTEPKWIRVRDEQGKQRFAGLNQPMSIEKLQAKAAEQGQPLIVPQEMPIENPIAELDVDILVETAPDVITLQQEQFGELVALAQGGVPIPPKALIEASALRNKEAIIEQLEGGQDEQQKAAIKELQGLVAQLDLRVKKAETEKAEADAELTKAKVEGQELENVKTAQEAGVIPDGRPKPPQPPPGAARAATGAPR